MQASKGKCLNVHFHGNTLRWVGRGKGGMKKEVIYLTVLEQSV